MPLAIMAFVFFLTEGAIFDWSGVFLRTQLGADLSAAGIGYAAFSLLMASMWFCGDFWVARFGRLPVFVTGTIVGAAGLMLACLGRRYLLSVAGFGLVGIGLANCVPLIFSASAGQAKLVSGEESRRWLPPDISVSLLGRRSSAPLLSS